MILGRKRFSNMQDNWWQEIFLSHFFNQRLCNDGTCTTAWPQYRCFTIKLSPIPVVKLVVGYSGKTVAKGMLLAKGMHLGHISVCSYLLAMH